MAEKECPSCALEVDNNDKVCPYCGYEFPDYSPGFKWIALILAILLLIFMLLI